MTSLSPSWIGLHWDTAGVQVWVHDQNGQLSAQTQIPAVEPHQIAGQLNAYLPARQTTPVICSGLPFIPVSAYRAVPVTAVSSLLQVQTEDPRLQLLAIPGLSQKKPADMMCGDETAIAGILAAEPDFDGVVCSISNKSVWTHISAGEIVSFQSFLTPELALGLMHGPLLAPAVAQGNFRANAFTDVLENIIARPQNFSSALGRIPASAALNGTDVNTCWSRLMGAVIGLELSGARPYWLGQRVIVLGDAMMTPLYVAALAHVGLQAETRPRTDAVLAGLCHVHNTYVAPQ